MVFGECNRLIKNVLIEIEKSLRGRRDVRESFAVVAKEKWAGIFF